MTQGAENDLIDIRFLEESTPVIYFRSNEPLEDLNTNVLLVDDKAILARDTADAAQVALDGHIGQGGISHHAGATTSVAGFMSVTDKLKLDGIQAEAQLNILAPVDAIELISRKATTLHAHPLATPSLDGLMSIADKTKLNGIQDGAQVNNITPAQATQLTSGGNADSLHGHGFSVGSEGFTAAVHLTVDHAGLQGVEAFPGFIGGSTAPNNAFVQGPYQWDQGVTVFNHDFSISMSSLEVLSANYGELLDRGTWGNEPFQINDVSVVGNTGTITYESPNFCDTAWTCYMCGWGVA